MQSQITRRRLLAGGAGSGLALLAGCTSMTPFVGQRIATEYTLDVETAEQLSVIGEVGKITIVGEDREDVDLDVVKQSSSLRTDLEDLDVETQISGDTMEIRAEFDQDLGWLESPPSVDLDIRIPRSLSVSRVHSIVGSAELRDVRGDLEIESSTGSLTIDGVDGSVDAQSTTGAIHIRDVSGSVAARSTTGRISVRSVGETGDLSTNTGRIETDVPAIDGDTRISTTTGRIEAAVNPEIDADIRASTTTGRIETGALALEDGSFGDNAVSGKLGDGGPTLEFETTTGRIELDVLE